MTKSLRRDFFFSFSAAARKIAVYKRADRPLPAAHKRTAHRAEIHRTGPFLLPNRCLSVSVNPPLCVHRTKNARRIKSGCRLQTVRKSQMCRRKVFRRASLYHNQSADQADTSGNIFLYSRPPPTLCLHCPGRTDESRARFHITPVQKAYRPHQ